MDGNFSLIIKSIYFLKNYSKSNFYYKLYITFFVLKVIL